MGSLDGKVAIVTGAGRGIGRGEAMSLAAHGARVVVNDLGASEVGAGSDASLAEEVVAEITASGATAVANHDDVATWAGAERLVGQAVDTFGRLDVLVNNAGILRDAISFKMTEEEFDSVTRVHLKGHFAPSRFAALHWREESKAGREVNGRIINTTSEAGLYGNAGQANYAAAKAGIAAMTVVLARELERYGVTVNAIAPRALTRMTEPVLGSFYQPPPEGELDPWDPDNVAPVVAWLAGDDAADISGQVFVVFGNKLYLMAGWQMVAKLEAAGRLDAEDLAKRRHELFAGHSTTIPPMGFGE